VALDAVVLWRVGLFPCGGLSGAVAFHADLVVVDDRVQFVVRDAMGAFAGDQKQKSHDCQDENYKSQCVLDGPKLLSVILTPGIFYHNLPSGRSFSFIFPPYRQRRNFLSSCLHMVFMPSYYRFSVNL
jgi:hypothetical protein